MSVLLYNKFGDVAEIPEKPKMNEEKQERKRHPTRVRLNDGRTADYVMPGPQPKTHIVVLDDCGCRRTVHEKDIKLMA